MKTKKKVFAKNGTLFSPSSGKNQKKKVFTKTGALFSPNSSGDLRSDIHQSQRIRWDADVDHTQIIGGVQSNYWGIYPPRVSAPLLTVSIFEVGSIRDFVHSGFCPIRDFVRFWILSNLGFFSFGILPNSGFCSIQYFIHSGFCPIRNFVRSGFCFSGFCTGFISNIVDSFLIYRQQIERYPQKITIIVKTYSTVNFLQHAYLDSLGRHVK